MIAACVAVGAALAGCADPSEGLPDAPPATYGWTDLTDTTGAASISTHWLSASFADMTGDGVPDLVVPGPGLVIYRNDGAGHFAPWVDIALPLGELTDNPWRGDGAHAITDLDGDGRLDVILAVGEGHRLATFFNDGCGRFTVRMAGAYEDDPIHEVGFSLGVLTGRGGERVVLLGRDTVGLFKETSSATCQYDPLGINIECPIDIVATSALAFRVDPRSRRLERIDDPRWTIDGNALAFGVHDFDGDGWDDVLAAVDFDNQVALRGTADGFEAPPAKWGVDVFGHGMGVALGDWDEDGATDAVVTTLGGVFDFAGQPGGGFTFRTEASPFMTRRRNMWPWSTLFSDLDNDGKLDLFVVNAAGNDEAHFSPWIDRVGGPSDYIEAYNLAFMQQPDGQFREIELPFAAFRPKHGWCYTFAIADIDGDGAVELALPMRNAEDRETQNLVIGRLDASRRGHGLTVRLSAELATSGTRVELTCGGKTQVRDIYGAEGAVNAARTEAHFGCGDATTYEALTVRARDGRTWSLPGGPLDRAVLVGDLPEVELCEPVTVKPPVLEPIADGNDTPELATPLVLDAAETTAVLDPPTTDVDYYVFTGLAGEAIAVHVREGAPGVDPTLTLLDASLTPIAANDDANPRSGGDAALFTVLPADGAYYLKVTRCDPASAVDCSEPASAALAGYALSLTSVDPASPAVTAEAPEPNDTLAGAAVIKHVYDMAIGVEPSILVGRFEGETDIDVYTLTIPQYVKTFPYARLTTTFHPQQAGPSASGSRAPFGRMWLTPVDQPSMVLAQIDLSAGDDRDRRLTSPIGQKQHYLFVERDKGAASDDDFYFIVHDLMGSPLLEAGEAENGVPAKAAPMESLGEAEGVHHFAVEGDIVYLGKDVDHFRIPIPAGLAKGRVTARCEAWRVGSGLRGLSLTLLREKGGGVTSLGTVKESAVDDAVLTDLPIAVDAGDLLLEVSADAQDFEVVGAYYRCTADLY